VRLISDGLLGEALLLGNRDRIYSTAGMSLSSVRGITVVDAAAAASDVRYHEEYRNARNLSVLEGEIINEALSNPVTIGALMLRFNEVDGFIGGIRSTTAEILRAGINIIRADRRVGVITSFTIISTGRETIGENGLIILCDPVVNPDPSVSVLCKSAEAVAYFSRQYLGIVPKIAFLSYSTKGSAGGKSVDKMSMAAERARRAMPEIMIEGELQLDAALSADVAKRKDPNGELKGRANIFIFPNLDSANIGSKIFQYFSDSYVVGPIIYGLNRPYNDISRAASVDDIYNLALVTQLQSD